VFDEKRIKVTGNQEFTGWYSGVPWFSQRYQRIDVQAQDGLLSVLFRRQPGPRTRMTSRRVGGARRTP
jgi:hypothetical protein